MSALARLRRWWLGSAPDGRRITLATWSPTIHVDINTLDLVTVDIWHDDGTRTRLLLSLVMPLPAARELAAQLNAEIIAHTVANVEDPWETKKGDTDDR